MSKELYKSYVIVAEEAEKLVFCCSNTMSEIYWRNSVAQAKTWQCLSEAIAYIPKLKAKYNMRVCLKSTFLIEIDRATELEVLFNEAKEKLTKEEFKAIEMQLLEQWKS